MSANRTERVFEIGDTVQLKSGGPVMTVERVSKSGGRSGCTCIWFKDEKKEFAFFPHEALRPFKMD